MSAALPAKGSAFRFPAPTGAAQADGLALLHHVIRHNVTPPDLAACQLALHVAPLAFLGTPEAVTVAAVNRAVDALSAAVRRLSAEQRALEADTARRLAKLAALFDGLDDRPTAGPMAPIVPVPPTPPQPDAVTPPSSLLEDLAQQLADKAGIPLAQARDIITAKARQRLAQTPEAA